MISLLWDKELAIPSAAHRTTTWRAGIRTHRPRGSGSHCAAPYSDWWGLSIATFDYWRVPSGELTFCHGKSPFLMGKSTISMAIFNCYVSSPEGNVSSCFGGCEWSRSGVDCWICETNGRLYTYTWYCIPYHHTPILSRPKDIHSNSYIMLYNNGSWKFVHELKLLHNQGCIIIRIYIYYTHNYTYM